MKFWSAAASWPDFAAFAGGMAGDESSLSSLADKLWRRLKREAASLPFLEDVLTAHYCAFDRHTPIYVKVFLAGAVAYFAVPDDLLPDMLLGVADEAAVLAGAFKLISSHIKPEHREAARRQIERLRAS